MKGHASTNIGVLILFLLAGIVLGGFVSDYLTFSPALSWLGYGKEFGLSSPLTLDLGVLKIQFGLTLHFTIAGIIGMILAVFIYKKM